MKSPESKPCAVITRPAPDHIALREALRLQGFDVLHCPAFEILPLASAVRKQRLRRLAEFDLVIVTSPHAARVLIETCSEPAAVGVQWIAPGRGTAVVLEQAGCSVVTPAGGGTSEDLLALPGMTNVAGQSAAILAAPGGRTLMLDTLRQRGAQADMIFLYERKSRPVTAELRERMHAVSGSLWIFVSSANTLDQLYTNASARERVDLNKARWVVSSHRLAEIAEKYGVSDLLVADGASDAAMLATAKTNIG